ncbi:MAG TPA: hypothetical protein VEF55_11465, partial [Candidatus Binatia bacterium]|nr:hypothetical protein [Candidatus Binatia bacterium]
MSGFLAAQPWQGAVAMLFVGAALALAIPHARTSWAAALVVLGAAAVFVIDLSLRGVAPHAADGVSIFAGPLIATLAALSALAGGGALRELSAAVAPFAMALALCAAGGWVFALMAADWIAFALAAEVAWLAGAGLVAAADARRGSLNGALRMIAIG